MKRFVVFLMLMIALSSTSFAMIFSQPVKVGTIVASNLGGFAFRDGVYNSGSLSSNAGRREVYSSGIARFSDGSDALYFHYKWGDIQHRYENTIMRFGDKDITNSILVNLMVSDVFKINNDRNFALYLIHDYYDLPEENGYIVIGKQKDGKWVKYFDTDSVTRTYFGNTGYAVWTNNSIYYQKVSTKNNLIIIPYQRYNTVNKKYYSEGEFRFKWDEAAQWFGVEQVVY